MKKSSIIKQRFLLILALFMFWALQPRSGFAKKVMEEDQRALVEILDEIAKQYKVFFNYESRFVQDVYVHFEAKENESLESVIKRLLEPTELKYKLMSEKYVVIYKDDKKGNRNIKKIERKLQQINNLKDKGNIQLIQDNKNRLEMVKDISSSLEKEKQSLAQISGTVKDNTGEPLIGVNILIEGTSTGTTSDVNGKFELNVPDGKNTLIFSYTGYLSQKVNIDGRSTLNITLAVDNKVLQELVVVGYAEQKKVNLTGAVEVLEMEELVNTPVTSTSQLMYGRFSGLTLTQGSGLPGNDGATINIRGLGTFNDSSPLIVVDGMIVEKNEFDNLAPSDVKSISVLKDASAGAIYGSRGANGVILVTTKGGEAGKFKVEYAGFIGWQEVTKVPEYLNAENYALLLNEKFENENPTNFIPRYTEEQLELIRNGSDPDLFAQTTWSDEILRTAPMVNQYLSFSGGNEKTTFRLSLGYLNQDAIVVGKFRNERYNLRLNLVSKATEWLTISNNLSGWVRDFQGPTGGTGVLNGDNGVIYQFSRSSPTIPVRYSNGDFGHIDGAFNNPNASFPTQNAVRKLMEGNFESQTYSINERLSLRFQIIKGLSFETANTINLDFVNRSDFNPRIERLGPDGTLISGNEVNNLSNGTSFETSLLTENILRFNKVFADVHDIQIMAGHSAQRVRSDGFSGSLEGFPTDNLEEFNAGGILNPVVSGGAAEVTRQSFFARVNYVYNEKYLLELTVRRDGSSKFGPGNRYGTFPSISAGWRISEEDFMANVGFIDNLKVRASWGRNGNDRIDNFIFQQTFNLGQDYVIGNDQIVGGAAVTSLANPFIQWETTEQFDIGIDAGFLNNRLQITADYFRKNSFDVLYNNFPIPNTLGVGNLNARNAADVANQGVEVGANFRDAQGDFNYGFGGNFTYMTNEITGLGGGQETISGSSILRVGHPIRAYYGYYVLGIFQSQEQIDGAPIHFNGTAPGDFQYADFSGPDGVPDGVIDADDRIVIGNPHPRFTFNFNGQASYKGLDLSFVFQGVGGVERLMKGNGQEPMTSDRNNALSYWTERWTEENPSTTLPRLGTLGNNALVSTFYLEDASYLRLKNIEIGYTLPKVFTEKFGVQMFRIYASGQNLLTFTGLENFDPERATGNINARNVPIYKVYTMGVNITF